MGFTAEQEKAVASRGKVLVSASAGAGKTTVMITRLADVIQEGAGLDRILAVTFTKKAAAQMKEKLRAELIERLSSAPQEKRENIRAQLGKISSADISTIHSFCARLIRTYFYALDGVDASFEIVADGAELTELKERALDDLFDRLYAEKNTDFFYVLERLKRKRSDRFLRDLIIKSYDEVRVHPDYKNLPAVTESTFSDSGFEMVCEELGEKFGARCAAFAAEVEGFKMSGAPVSNADGYFAVLDDMLATLKAVSQSKDIFVLPGKLTGAVKPRVKSENAEYDERFSLFVKSVKKHYSRLASQVSDRDGERAAFEESGKLARAFISVLLQFDGEYAAVKRDEGKLDYADLEHYAYLLVAGEDGGDGVLRDVKAQVNCKYSYVFVDEYQDVNPIQNAIIDAVGQGDVFTVGDEKQAIYGFRGSRSRFFSTRAGEMEKSGTHIILPHNFRSCAAVVSFVNDLFSGIMRKPLTDFDYADGGVMISGAPMAAGSAGLCFFEKDGKEREEADGVYSVARQAAAPVTFGAESRAIVNLVKEILTSGEVYDEALKKPRRAEAGDICILTRKRDKQSVAEIERALAQSGYSVDGATSVNVCGRTEIKRILNILSYLDNNEQDVPLAAAMLSPLGNFTEQELAEIRIFGGTGWKAPPFRGCVQKYASAKRDLLARKICEFQEKCASLMRLSDFLGAAKLIDEITKEGGFVAEFSSGEDKLSALARLQAEAYGANGELGLHAFLDKLAAENYQVKMPVAPSSDSIKVMTMHSSKGLEFPVVIVADITASFSGDERDEMPFDEKLGFAPRRYDVASRGYGETLLRTLCKMRRSEEELKNEINLFYVACTRAKDSLYVMVGGECEFDSCGVFTAKNYAELFDVNGTVAGVRRAISTGELQKTELLPRENIVLSGAGADSGTAARVREEFFRKEPFWVDGLPVKSSATKILSLSAEDETAPVMFDENDEKAGAAAIESGLAYHKFLQLCDFEIKDLAGVKGQISTWLAQGILSENYAEILNAEKLCRILDMPVFPRLKGKKLFREREFLCALTAKEYFSLAGKGETEGDGNVIVQGAIDLLALTYANGQVVAAEIIDYKYSSRNAGELAEKYAPQLALYKRAVLSVYPQLTPSSVKTTIVNIKSCGQIDL